MFSPHCDPREGRGKQSSSTEPAREMDCFVAATKWQFILSAAADDVEGLLAMTRASPHHLMKSRIARAARAAEVSLVSEKVSSNAACWTPA